eukprot:TRINITY_DN14792_c0_g1_i1.p2 TRINITY_DN14792_c0_g1~~TRINITY_DN14792_c0_g1_i1.p2  ORF type:complete len:101 (+),score=17.15 TRINITY_DN14792_c0_g1_i1:20-322(+)
MICLFGKRVEVCELFQIQLCAFFFFFKQKTAYEIMPSLVGSEMCIRDSQRRVHGATNWYAISIVSTIPINAEISTIIPRDSIPITFISMKIRRINNFGLS